MTAPRFLRRRSSISFPSSPLTGSGAGVTGDMLVEGTRRVWAVGLVAAVLWGYSLVLNSLMSALAGHAAIMGSVWPIPGAVIGGVGLASALGLMLLTRTLRHRPQLLVDISTGFLVFASLLVALLTQWEPPPVTPRVSWLCVIILIYPAIVPTAPARTLWVSLLAASMDPLAVGIARMRGVGFDAHGLYFLWNFAPTYLCAFIAVIPARIIRRLGQQVRRAREIGSYRLEEVLGKGGMGEVYRASHQMLARPAAIKIIRPEVLHGGSADNARVVMERFRREAEASALLRSPHTISLYDFGVAQDGTFFLVMEMLQGLDLQTLVERFGPQPAERVAYLLIQACHSLEEAHCRGLVHRDIKPSNIFACRMGLAVDFVKVLDFGLVKALGAGAGDTEEVLLTGPSATAGTPAYMAPEVARGEATIDHRVDLYALGCVGYWLLTGRLVFEGRQSIRVMLQHADAPPVPPSERTELEIPPAIDEVIMSCLAKDPGRRPANAGELARRLAAAAPHPAWDDDRAQRWWERHHPESARTEPCYCDITLTKALSLGETS
jgi:serine/threonine-protein kinase